LKERISVVRKQKTRVYAPTYFGAGLWLGKLWNVQTGYGRWNYILKDNLPSPTGQRILDLGSNNAHNSIQLLRKGAREVVAVEMNEKQIDLGHLLLEGFEWIDNKKYNFSYIHSNMNKIPNMDLGKFDMVMALCSLYYLPDEEMNKVVQYISTITDVFVLQCNRGNLERYDTHLFEKASLNYAINLMKNHGFSDIQVITPPGYYRPLVIGTKETRNAQSPSARAYSSLKPMPLDSFFGRV
jgi:SAM-dependent methyltransferase